MARKRGRIIPRLPTHVWVALFFLVVAGCLAVLVAARADDWAVAVAKREALGRWGAGKVNVHHLAQTWCWRVAIANVVFFVGLAVTSRFWLRAGGFRGSVPRRSLFPSATCGLVVALFLITILAGILRAPRWPRIRGAAS